MNYTADNISVALNHTSFNYTEARFVGSANSVLQVGELGVITIEPTTPLALRQKGLIQIIPEAGTMIMREVIAPATWGTKDYIQLFP
jgi:hypothetical protein